MTSSEQLIFVICPLENLMYWDSDNTRSIVHMVIESTPRGVHVWHWHPTRCFCVCTASVWRGIFQVGLDCELFLLMQRERAKSELGVVSTRSLLISAKCKLDVNLRAVSSRPTHCTSRHHPSSTKETKWPPSQEHTHRSPPRSTRSS